MDAEKIFVPRRQMSGSHRLSTFESEMVAATNPHVARSLTEIQNEIRRKAHRHRTLMAGKPEVTITVEVRWSGFAFPEEAQDVYESERVGQALGMDVPDHIDTLVVARLVPSILGDTVGDARDTDPKD